MHGHLYHPQHLIGQTRADRREPPERPPEKGYSVSELAIATGLTEAEIRLAEDGRMQNPDYIRRIKSALA
ncbi:hypothetical protein F4V90_18605 [Neorhizobium galegae]|nr:hypothetical protein F4V90_18605 [Neorhizobium galegae]